MECVRLTYMSSSYSTAGKAKSSGTHEKVNIDSNSLTCDCPAQVGENSSLVTQFERHEFKSLAKLLHADEPIPRHGPGADVLRNVMMWDVLCF